MCIQEYFQLVPCWEVCPLLECPLSEASLYSVLCFNSYLHSHSTCRSGSRTDVPATVSRSALEASACAASTARNACRNSNRTRSRQPQRACIVTTHLAVPPTTPRPCSRPRSLCLRTYPGSPSLRTISRAAAEA